MVFQRPLYLLGKNMENLSKIIFFIQVVKLMGDGGGDLISIVPGGVCQKEKNIVPYSGSKASNGLGIGKLT